VTVYSRLGSEPSRRTARSSQLDVNATAILILTGAMLIGIAMAF
jgi:hypothetical protein